MEEGWARRPLLGDAGAQVRGDGQQRQARAEPIFAYSDQDDSASPFEDDRHSRSALYPPQFHSRRPPSAISPSYINRARAGLPLPSSSSLPLINDVDSSRVDPFLYASGPAWPAPLAPQNIAYPSAPPFGTAPPTRAFFSTGKHSSRRHERRSLTPDSAPSTRTSGSMRTGESGTEVEEDTEEEATRLQKEKEKKAKARRARRKEKERRRRKSHHHGGDHHHHHHSSDSEDVEGTRKTRKRHDNGLHATLMGEQAAVRNVSVGSGDVGAPTGG